MNAGKSDGGEMEEWWRVGTLTFNCSVWKVIAFLYHTAGVNEDDWKAALCFSDTHCRNVLRKNKSGIFICLSHEWTNMIWNDSVLTSHTCFYTGTTAKEQKDWKINHGFQVQCVCVCVYTCVVVKCTSLPNSDFLGWWDELWIDSMATEWHTVEKKNPENKNTINDHEVKGGNSQRESILYQWALKRFPQHPILLWENNNHDKWPKIKINGRINKSKDKKGTQREGRTEMWDRFN